MKKHPIIMLISICLIGSVGCSNNVNTPTLNAPVQKTYKVTRETGLYESSSSDDYEETIAYGTIVGPVGNRADIYCTNSKAESVRDLNIQICNVQIVNTEETRWILKSALVEN